MTAINELKRLVRPQPFYDNDDIGIDVRKFQKDRNMVIIGNAILELSDRLDVMEKENLQSWKAAQANGNVLMRCT